MPGEPLKAAPSFQLCFYPLKTAGKVLIALWVATLAAVTSFAFASNPADEQVRHLLAELVRINTAPSGGATTEEAAGRMAQHLIEAGFDESDVRVMGPSPDLSALVARYRSPRPKAPPVLLVAHLDVVEALPADWSFDPFQLTEKDGWLYGRGAWDNKAGAAILVANFIRLKAEGFEPDRDFIMLLAADEETWAKGLQWLLREHRPLIDAEFALNTDSGYVLMSNGQAAEFRTQTAEKVYATYELEVTNPGGHSSKPRMDNAIYTMAKLLQAIEDYRFPIDLNETTKAAFEHYLPHAPSDERPLVKALAEGKTEAPELAQLPHHPVINALARTTCVATQLTAGHARNALPQTARVVVNCRLVPQADPDSAMLALQDIGDRFDATLETYFPPMPSPPSPLEPELISLLSDVAGEIWPGIDLVPEMETGATDGAYLRNAGIPTYGISALEVDPEDDRTHGRDERIGVQALYRANHFWYLLLKRLGETNS